MLVYLLLACTGAEKLGETDTSVPYEGDGAGECSDGADNDQDGLFDCDDEGCAGSPDCQQDTDTTDTQDTSDTGDTQDTSDTGDTQDTSDTGDTSVPPQCNPGSGSTANAENFMVQISGSVADNQTLAGWSVAICDINADGYDDLAVGDPYAAGGLGRVSLFYGPGDAWSSYMDMSGSYADAYIYGDGSAMTGSIGSRLACGDVNGDGSDDLVIAGAQNVLAPVHNSVMVNNSLHVFYNNGAALSGQVFAADANVNLTYDSGEQIHWPSMWTADADGDGMDEVMFFMNLNSYYGNAAANADNKLWVLNVDTETGSSFEDVVSHRIQPDNVDGITTVVPYSGGLYIGQGFHHGGGSIPGKANFISGAVSSNMLLSSDSTAILDGDGDKQFGQSAVFADFDQDGTLDSVFGAPGEGGAIYVNYSSPASFSGTTSGLTADQIFTSNFNGTKGLGWKMSNLGDFNGDGHPELLVTAMGEEASDTGKAYVVDGLCLDGTATNINTASLLNVNAGTAGDGFGAEVASGDIDGDGIPDFVVGSPYYKDNTGLMKGKAYVWLSSKEQ